VRLLAVLQRALAQAVEAAVVLQFMKLFRTVSKYYTQLLCE
jgi:hypothetical protein